MKFFHRFTKTRFDRKKQTLIALLLIHQYAGPTFAEGKQTVFLVPSVALAIQQSTTISRNLPYTVGTAFSESVRSKNRRQKLQSCNIIVATHGAMLELLTHYEEEFHVAKWNLLILDECHHCTGNAPYAVIMREYYKKCPDKPRVLGLTASPLINVKKNSTDEQLSVELAKLEDLMDAKIASVESLLEQQRQEEGNSDEEYNDDTRILNVESKESIIQYVRNNPEQSGISWPETDLENFQMHFCRRKEMRQLQGLHIELGPLPILLYVPVLYHQFSKNIYEGENEEQLRSILSYLKHIVRWCVVDYERHGIKSNKFIKLLMILEREIEDNPESNACTSATISDCVSSSATGVVFVQQRIKAMALHTYFERRQMALENGEKWPPSAHTIQTSLEAVLGNDNEPWKWIDVECEKSTQEPMRDSNKNRNQNYGQFDDAEGEDEGFVLQPSSNYHAPAPNTCVEETSSKNENVPVVREGVLIRCGVLVRNSHRIFKSLHAKAKWNNYPTKIAQVNDKKVEEEADDDDENDMETNGVTYMRSKKYVYNGERQIRSIINRLRRGVINVVIATSVIEEGVDVQSCSFVVVFDQILSIKSYIQMKGRARQEKSKFFLFQEIGSPIHRRALALDEARALEMRVQNFIRFQERKRRLPDVCPDPNILYECDSSDVELLAAQQGFYRADQGTVRLETAKSLLYRHALKQPLDPAVRKTRESFTAYMPEFDSLSKTLLLPAYIGSGLRHILLPSFLWKKSQKDRQNILALMACVRLHRHGLLTDRLLPFARKDLLERVQNVTKSDCDEEPPFPNFMPCKFKKGTSTVFLYKINLDGIQLEKARMVLRSRETRLAIVLCEPIKFNPELIQHHAEFGALTCNLCSQQNVLCTEEELCILSRFFAFLMNARWKRRTKDSSFQHDVGVNDSSVICSYSVACVDRQGRLDFPYMLHILKESARDKLERLEAVQSVSLTEQLPVPRLWVTSYDELSIYIVYGPSGQTCAAEFPAEAQTEEIRTFRDYYRIRRNVNVHPSDPLFLCQRLWKLPAREATSDKTEARSSSMDQQLFDVLPVLCLIQIPHSVCLEASQLADPSLALECIILPQFLYHLERHLTAKALHNFCSTRFPVLAQCLASRPVDELVGLLTAASCAEPESYERLEWFGDGVLKLIQTDVILGSKELRDWIQHLHEGDLSCLRSEMCSNARLTKSCRRLELDRFLLTAKLERGLWTPSSLGLFSATRGVIFADGPSDKTAADMIEAILGFVYHYQGYDASLKVAEELRITIPWEKRHREDQFVFDKEISSQLLSDAIAFTGYRNWRNHVRLREAFTHGTCPTPNISSYQRLEWIGDAVLCVAIREWIYNTYPDSTAGEMVDMASTIETNAALAFLSLRSGIYKHLNHRDRTLPGRIDAYEFRVSELGKGLWFSDPPKALADIVESIIGAVFLDAGFAAGKAAALNIISPILQLFKHCSHHDDILGHPKHQLQEVGGNILQLCTNKESDATFFLTGRKVWGDSRYVSLRPNGSRDVATVSCLGSHIVSVADSSSQIAVVRTCYIVLTVLNQHPELKERFLAARSNILSKLSLGRRKTKSS